MLAGAVSLMRVLLICGLIAPTILKELAEMLGPAAVILAIGGFIGSSQRSGDSSDFSHRNPLEVMVVFRFAFLLAFVTILTRITLTVFGTQSLLAVAFITARDWAISTR